MESLAEDSLAPTEDMPLSYDDEVPYEKQVASEPSLADRISRNKLYLLADSTVARSGKRKRGDDNEEEAVIDEEVAPEDTTYRPNALLVKGTPISQLSTDKIFAYAAHYTARPLGLEWVDDTTCVLVFKSGAVAEEALGLLTRDPKQQPNDEGLVTAHSIPMSMWPAEERISASLGKSSGLRGALHVRWARVDDVKKKNARRQSEFYRKHGTNGNKRDGPEPGGLAARIDDGEGPAKRRRQDDESTLTREGLDQELDAFLQEGEEAKSEEPEEPPSKMYADRMEAEADKSLLERTSVMRAHPAVDRESFGHDRRHREPDRERRPRGGRGRRERNGQDAGSHRGESRTEPRRTEPRPHKTQEELDAELDAFLNERE